MRIFLFLIFCLATPLRAEGERAGDFDYYVLALSWSPTWCTLEGDARRDRRCDDGAALGFTLHGLWPQNESGWPSYCRTGQRDPSRRETGQMADIMGSGGLAWHQWKKHGRCSGLSSADYFALSRDAFAAIDRPAIFRRLTDDIRISPKVVEDAFLEANPDLDADMVTITCKSGMMQEVRVCLTTDLTPRQCGRDVRRDCRASSTLMTPIR